jgi:lysophospholipase L1-like esterase
MNLNILPKPLLLAVLLSAGLVACSGDVSPEAEAQAGAPTNQAGTTSGAGSGGAAQPMAGASPGGGGQVTAGASTGGTAGEGMGGATGGGGSGGSAGGGGSGGVAPASEVPLDPALLSKCTGTMPIVCAFDVPADGNYTVTVELGSPTASTSSRVQAEEHRISVPTTLLSGGQYSKHTFSLNVREEKHDGYGAPGKVLNLLIDNGDPMKSAMVPGLRGIGFKSTPSIPTVFVAGDSTTCDWEPTYAATKAGPLERGWAQELSQFLQPGVAVANYADSGETASGFYGKFWPPAKAALREGDYVLIGFGHNDQGDFTAEQFKANMLKYVTDARAAKATPILFTPVARKSAKANDYGFGGLDQATRDLAAAEKVALIDATKLTFDYYATLPDKSVMFATASEGTHFSEHGATEVSRLITTFLKTTELTLKAHLR